jgi:DNA-binding response OmpR family regulator
MRKILLVDDEPYILTLVRVTLEDPQWVILEATDGRMALDVVERERPDLVLLDVRMPHLDGFAVCRAIRANASLGHTKIVMLTASGQEVDRAHGQEVGADDYLTKPFSPLALLALVQSLLPQSEVLPRVTGDESRSDG